MTASARERILKWCQEIRRHPSLAVPYVELIEEELVRDAERECSQTEQSRGDE